MGILLSNSNSKLKRTVHDDGCEISWSWKGPPGEHSPYPMERFAEKGHEVLYCFVDVLVAFKIMRNEINLGPQAVTTDVEKYMHLLMDCYDDGFTLATFVRVPEIHMFTDVTNWISDQPYQAIFTKEKATGDPGIKWKLSVQKHIISTKLRTGERRQEDLLNIVSHYAESGARLVCAEAVGYVRSSSANEQYTINGVELFFNIPVHRLPTIFTYHIISVSAHYHIVADATQTVQQVECSEDFLGQLRLFLNQGWKLIDICIDYTAIADDNT